MIDDNMRFTHHVAMVATLAGLALAQNAAGQAEEDFGAAPQEAPTPATAQPAPPTAVPAQAQSAGAAVLASTDAEKPGVRVEVTEFKRTGQDVVTLKFTLINDSAEKFEFGYDLGDPDMSTIDYKAIGGTHLIDNAGKKKYKVVRDASNKCVCSSGLDSLEPQSRMTLWARFPAPPPDVEKLSIMIPHFIPMDDVPLS